MDIISLGQRLHVQRKRNQLTQREAHLDLVIARSLDVAAHAVQLGPRALGTRQRHCLVPIGPVPAIAVKADDLLHEIPNPPDVTFRFHCVDLRAQCGEIERTAFHRVVIADARSGDHQGLWIAYPLSSGPSGAISSDHPPSAQR